MIKVVMDSIHFECQTVDEAIEIAERISNKWARCKVCGAKVQEKNMADHLAGRYRNRRCIGMAAPSAP